MRDTSIRSIRGANACLGERAWPSLAALPEVARPRLCGDRHRRRRRGGRRMRPARREDRDRAGRRLRGSGRRRRRARGAAARDLRRDRHARGRTVEPRRRRPAQQGDAHRQSDVRRARPAGRPHLRRLAFRQHDRLDLLAWPRARASALPRWSRSATRSISRSARSARRRSTIPASTATCCFSKPCGTPTGCAASRSRAAARGKPILAYKLGRSAAARELAVSHTGALAGEDDVADMFLAECGIARVDDARRPDRGHAAASRACRSPRRSAARKTVGVVTTTAGGATMVVDPLSLRGLSVEAPSPETLERIQRSDRHRGEARAADRSHGRGRTLRRHEGGARHSCWRRRNSISCSPRSARPRARIRRRRCGRSSTAPARASRSPPSWCRTRRRRWPCSRRRACRASARPRPAPTPSRRRCRAARRGC